jgi:hypothetical protein
MSHSARFTLGVTRHASITSSTSAADRGLLQVHGSSPPSAQKPHAIGVFGEGRAPSRCSEQPPPRWRTSRVFAGAAALAQARTTAGLAGGTRSGCARRKPRHHGAPQRPPTPAVSPNSRCFPPPPHPRLTPSPAVGRYALRFDVPGTEGRLEPWVLCALRKMVENGVFGPTPLRPAAGEPGEGRETGVEVDRRGPPPPPPPVLSQVCQ